MERAIHLHGTVKFEALGNISEQTASFTLKTF